MGREWKGGKGGEDRGGEGKGGRGGEGTGKEGTPNILLHPQFQFSRNMPDRSC